MRVQFDEIINCPHCGYEDVAWQVTREYAPVVTKTEGRLIIDTICQNPDCKEYGRVKRAYKALEVI